MTADGWQSPYRIAPETWASLKQTLGLTERDTAPRPRAPARTWQSRPKGTATDVDPAHASDPWYIALRRVGRLGRDLGDGRFALLCINDAQHTRPDETVENAKGSTVLLPPCAGSRFGLPNCSHAHCRDLVLRDWVLGVGPAVYADALAESLGRRQAEGYLLTERGIFTAKRAPLRLTAPEGFDPGDDRDGAEAPPDEPFRWRPGERLTTFYARIVANVAEHDAAGTRLFCEIDARVDDARRLLRIPVTEYTSLAWVTQLGTDAVIEAGRDTRDKVRAAIQHLSRPTPRRDAFLTTGWREVGERPVYLHAGGAIGAEGDVEVRLHDPVLAQFAFEKPLEGEALRAGVEACAELIALAPDVTVPLFGATWRAPLGASPLTVYISGPPKSGKTLLAGLAQAHFGRAFHERNLPASLKHSTAAWLNAARAIVGDALFVADDFLINGTSEDLRISEKLDLIARAQYNGAGARRLARDGSMQRSEPSPRSLLVVTGEVLPRNHSLRTRLLVAEMTGRLDVDLDAHKALAREGAYAGTMAAFLHWMAPRHRELTRSVPERALRVIEGLRGSGKADDRTLALLAEVAVGVAVFLEFAAEVGLRPDAIAAIKAEVWRVLKASLVLQQAHQQEEEPGLRFVRLVRSVLTGFQGHITLKDGSAPDECSLWGWTAASSFTPSESEDGEAREPLKRPCGPRIGVMAGSYVWLLPDVALAAAQKLARETHDPLPLTRNDLGKRLHALGLLALSDIQTKRRAYTHRKRVKNGIIDGLCLAADTILGVMEGDDDPGVSDVLGGQTHPPTQETTSDFN